MKDRRVVQRLLTIATLAALGSGCASAPGTGSGGKPWSLPADARAVAYGAPTISFTMSQPGWIYVYDVTARALIHSAHLADPQIEVAPLLLKVDRDDEAVVVRSFATAEEFTLVDPIDPEHQFSIWFAPAAASDAATQRRRHGAPPHGAAPEQEHGTADENAPH